MGNTNGTAAPVKGGGRPKLKLVGELSVKLWSLDIATWQARAWAKAGVAEMSDAQSSTIIAGIDWVLSAGLAKALVGKPGVALVLEDSNSGKTRVAAIHVPANANTRDFEALINTPEIDADTLRKHGIHVCEPEALADGHDRNLRKRAAPFALSLLTTSPRSVEKKLYQASYKGVTDLVTKYVWPMPALYATRLAAWLQLTPNMITTVSLVLTILAFSFFWRGEWVAGLLAGWSMTFLDTVDGKLARNTMTYSKWGNLYDHGIDLVHPPFWYWAWFVGIQQTGASYGPLEASLIVILVGYVLGRAIEGVFVRRFGYQIHVWEYIDSCMRTVTARRNPNLLILTGSVLIGLPALGLHLVAIWTLVCTLFHAVRFVQSFSADRNQPSWQQF